MANMIARLGVMLGIDSAEFNRGIDAAGKKLEAFSAATEKYGKVAATAFLAASYAALRYADEISDVAKANEIAIDSVVKLQNALANSGGKAENAGRLLSSFTASIDKAAEGSFETQKVFKALGVSLDDLAKLNIDELFKSTVASLAAMEDPITRNAKAMELFGKAAKGVDFVELNDQLQAAKSLTDQQSESIEAAAASYDLLAQAARDVALIIGVELGTPLKESIFYIKQISGDVNVLGKIFKTVFETVAVLGANLEFVFSGIAREINHTFENAKLLASLDLKEAIKLNEKFDAENKRRREALDAYEARILGVRNAGAGRGFVNPEAPAIPLSVSEPRRAVIAGIDKEAVAAAKEAARELERQRKESNDRLIAQNKEVQKIAEDANKKMKEAFIEEQNRIEEINKSLAEQDGLFRATEATQRERQRRNSEDVLRQKEMLDLLHNGRNLRSEELELSKEKFQIEWRLKDAIDEINRLSLTPESRAARLERENELAKEAIALAEKRLEYANREREGTFAKGFTTAAGRAFRDAKTDFEMGQRAFESVIGNMESAILRFVQTGKLSFKDLARSIISDLIAIQLKSQATKLFSSFLPRIFSGVGGTGLNAVGATGGYNALAAYANGGDPNVGEVSLVGERGPELFIPKTAGTIIPNGKVSEAFAGKTTNVTNNYIQAIDVQSFEQRLLGSSNTIWAANQYAQKSLATNRGRT